MNDKLTDSEVRQIAEVNRNIAAAHRAIDLRPENPKVAEPEQPEPFDEATGPMAVTPATGAKMEADTLRNFAGLSEPFATRYLTRMLLLVAKDLLTVSTTPTCPLHQHHAIVRAATAILEPKK